MLLHKKMAPAFAEAISNKVFVCFSLPVGQGVRPSGVFGSLIFLPGQGGG